MELICKWLLVSLLVLQFFGSVHTDFKPRPAKPAGGYTGFIGTCLAVVLVGFLYWGAGVFSGMMRVQ